MPLKVSFLFRSGRQTWAETHYLLGGSDPDGVSEQAAVLELGSLRAKLLGRNAFLFAARLSTVIPPQNVTTMRFNPPLGGIYAGGGGAQGEETADIPNTDIMCAFKSKLTFKRGKIYLAGCIDRAIQTDPDFPDDIIPVPQFAGPFNAWRNELVQGTTWGTRVKTNPQSRQVLNIPVDGVGLATAGVQVSAPLVVGPDPVTVGGHIQLRGFRRRDLSLPDLNGIWQVDNVVNGVGGLTTYYLRGSLGIDPANFVVKGKAETIVPQYEGYLSIFPQRSGSRKRGGSIELRRGRARTRRSLR